MIAPGFVGTFDGLHFYLSNFHRGPVVIDGVTYASGEHAFNAAKTLDPAERAKVIAALTPAKAKRVGRGVTLRPGWDDRVRYRAMDRVVAEKFAAGTPLGDRLLTTGTDLLVEGTTWCDQHWGDCQCSEHFPWPGANHLGRTLMAHRSLLREDPADLWTRVAVTGHRPQSFTASQQAFARGELDRLAAKLRDERGTTVAISGMALGADQWWAQSALDAELDLWAYVPFEAQPGAWGSADRAAWARYRAAATRELVLGDAYDVRLFHARNEYMIRDADVVIAVYDPAKTSGGTASAVKKSRAAGKTLVLVDAIAGRTTLERPQS